MAKSALLLLLALLPSAIHAAKCPLFCTCAERLLRCNGTQHRRVTVPALTADLGFTDLDLHGNAISSVGKKTWKFYSSVVFLTLADNSLVELTDDSLGDLGRLRFLSLRDNPLRVLESSSLAALPALQILDLRGTPLSFSALQPLLQLAPPIPHLLLPISVKCCICKTQMAAATTAATVPARCALLCEPMKPSCVVTNAPEGPVTPPKLRPPSGLPIPTNSEKFDLSHLRWLIQERPVSLKNAGDLLSFLTVLDMVQDMKPNRTALGSFAQLIEDHCLNPDYEDVCVRTMTDVIVQIERHLGEGIIGQLETLAGALREESVVQETPPGVSKKTSLDSQTIIILAAISASAVIVAAECVSEIIRQRKLHHPLGHEEDTSEASGDTM
ncbi:uncharacterized protein LOC127530133 isoform X2 [Erpetoichthys calabaricus]|uniref:uncharacterized protein LOC127530133 isoform X2 n=1 Tax=Erpetoichthys calabaricus TaxID=27687 RepID=UPI002234D546|nr:uncharacterized protein LOC127530133 isoform X2 [Erpetoichthys calabaricus]